MMNNYYVNGVVTIPVSFPIRSSSEEQAIIDVERLLNRNTISVFDGDIQTWSTKSYPIVASRLSVKWFDASTEKEIV